MQTRAHTRLLANIISTVDYIVKRIKVIEQVQTKYIERKAIVEVATTDNRDTKAEQIIGIWEVGAKRPLNGVETPIPKNTAQCGQIRQKKNLFWRGDFTLFIGKSFQISDHFFPLLLPMDSKSLKKIGHPISGSGGKKKFKRYLKSIGPEGRCFEKSFDVYT